MRKQCLLHIGMHKTGTSSLQNALANYLTDPGFHYLEIGCTNHNQAFSSLFKKDPYAYHGNTSIGLGKCDVDEYRDAVEKKIISSFVDYANHVVEIISGEDIGYLDHDEAITLRDFLLNYFDNVVVVAYIRSPASYMNSAVQELIKHGANSFDFSSADPNYNRFRMFSDVFGADNVKYRWYDEIANNEVSVISDFCNLFDIKLDTTISVIENNKSLSLEAVAMLYIYQKHSFRHFTEHYFETQNALINALAHLGNTRLILGDNLIKPFVDNNHDGILFLERVLSCSLESCGFFNLNDKKELIISTEHELIDYAVTHIDGLVLLLADYGIIAESNDSSEFKAARLVRLLDCKINGSRLNSDFYL